MIRPLLLAGSYLGAKSMGKIRGTIVQPGVGSQLRDRIYRPFYRSMSKSQLFEAMFLAVFMSRYIECLILFCFVVFYRKRCFVPIYNHTQASCSRRESSRELWDWVDELDLRIGTKYSLIPSKQWQTQQLLDIQSPDAVTNPTPSRPSTERPRRSHSPSLRVPRKQCCTPQA